MCLGNEIVNDCPQTMQGRWRPVSSTFTQDTSQQSEIMLDAINSFCTVRVGTASISHWGAVQLPNRSLTGHGPGHRVNNCGRVGLEISVSDPVV